MSVYGYRRVLTCLTLQCVDGVTQYGLYLTAIPDTAQAQEVFNKALFVDPEDVSASIHLSNLLLSPPAPLGSADPDMKPTPSADDIQMAVGLLINATRYQGWDIAEAWYLLAKARRLQGSSKTERECLTRALELSRVRGIRVIREAVGDCL
jgi:tetratricopeptide (TPR) repeat protein